MDKIEDSLQYFQQPAETWDPFKAVNLDKSIRDAVIAKAYLLPDMTVVDIGSGFGFITADLAQMVKSVHLIRGSAAMLEEARENLSQFNNVEFHEADGFKLPFPEKSLEAIFANMYLDGTDIPADAIREMVSVLRPGGRLVITKMESHPNLPEKEIADQWEAFGRDQMRTWMGEAGLVNVIVDRIGHSRISVCVATGTRRMVMREAVQKNYAAVAQSGSCGCSSSSVETSGSGCCSSEANNSSCCGASESGGSCCSGSAYGDVIFTTDYSPIELSSAPKEAAEISLGCGNPLAMAGLKKGEVVLDIGSGGGLDAFLSAGKVGPTGKVIGVDMTPAMLERARASADRNQITNVEFRQGYAEVLPVADGEVDVIISNCVINLTEDKGQVFREALRVLKPGGRLEVSDMVTSGPLPISLRESAAGWSECVTGAIAEQEYLDLIAQAGFENVAARRSTTISKIAGVSVYSVIVSAIKPEGKYDSSARISD